MRFYEVEPQYSSAHEFRQRYLLNVLAKVRGD